MPNHLRKRDKLGNVWCNGCFKYLPENSFSKVYRTTNGSRTNLVSRCKPCLNKQRIKWHSNFKYMAGELVRKAAKRNREFELTREWFLNQWELQKGECYYTGIKMTWGHGKGRVWTNMSIDRVDSNLGYTIENCVLCCVGFNLMKTNLSLPAMEKMCKEFLGRRKLM